MAHIKGFIVTIKKDITDEDAERVARALRMFKLVISVRPVEVKYDDHIAEMRVRNDLHERGLTAPR